MASLLLLIALLLGPVLSVHLPEHDGPLRLPTHHPHLRHVCQQRTCRLQFLKKGFCHGPCSSCYHSFVKECSLKRPRCLHAPLHSDGLRTCKLCHVYFSRSPPAPHPVAPPGHVTGHPLAAAAVTHGDKCGSQLCKQQFLVTGHCWAKCIPCEAVYGNRCRSQACERQLKSGGRLHGRCATCAKYLHQLLDGSEIILGKSQGRFLASAVQPLLKAQSGPKGPSQVAPERGPPPPREPMPFLPPPRHNLFQSPPLFYYPGSFGGLQDFPPDVYGPTYGNEDEYLDYDYRY